MFFFNSSKIQDFSHLFGGKPRWMLWDPSYVVLAVRRGHWDSRYHPSVHPTPNRLRERSILRSQRTESNDLPDSQAGAAEAPAGAKIEKITKKT